MNRAIKFYFSLLFLLSTIFSFGQGGSSTISGQLLSKESQEPIPFASIYLKEKPIGTITNKEGYFVFRIPETLDFGTVIISAIGYSTLKKKVHTFKENETLFLTTQINQLEVSSLNLLSNRISSK